MSTVQSMTDLSTGAGNARDTLAAAAAQAERRARPRALPLIAAIAFAALSIWLGIQLASLESAKKDLAMQTRDAREVEQLGAAIAQSRAAAQASPDRQATDPVRQIRSKLADVAKAAGLGDNLVPTLAQDERDGMIETRITFTLLAKPMDSLMNFVESVIEQYPGTHVYSIDLTLGRGAAIRRPNTKPPEGWNLDVTFVRLERIE